MKNKLINFGLSLLTAGAALYGATATVQAADKKPNIVFILGDDVGVWNISAYHRGMMGGRTPNIDKLAAQGALCTDYYAQQSNEEWTVPLNFQVAQLFKVGDQPMQAFIGARYYAEKPTNGPEWGIRFGLIFLFPK